MELIAHKMHSNTAIVLGAISWPPFPGKTVDTTSLVSSSSTSASLSLAWQLPVQPSTPREVQSKRPF